MKHRRTLMIFPMAFTCLVFGLGFATAERGQEDKREILMTNYRVTGTIKPLPGQTFPRKWGRLVNLVFDPSDNKSYFIFEAEDGTVRAVRTKLDWKDHVIENIDVMTIGRK